MRSRGIDTDGSDLERLRLQLAIKRTVRLDDDLKKLVDSDPLEDVVPEKFEHHYGTEPKVTSQQPGGDDQAFVLRNPLPTPKIYSIERVTEKFSTNRSGGS